MQKRISLITLAAETGLPANRLIPGGQALAHNPMAPLRADGAFRWAGL